MHTLNTAGTSVRYCGHGGVRTSIYGRTGFPHSGSGGGRALRFATGLVAAGVRVAGVALAFGGAQRDELPQSLGPVGASGAAVVAGGPQGGGFRGKGWRGWRSLEKRQDTC